MVWALVFTVLYGGRMENIELLMQDAQACEIAGRALTEHVEGMLVGPRRTHYVCVPSVISRSQTR